MGKFPVIFLQYVQSKKEIEELIAVVVLQKGDRMRHCAVCISLFLASMLFTSMLPLAAQEPVVVHPVPVDSLFPEPLADQRFPRFTLLFPAMLTHAIDTRETDGYGGIREALEFGGVKGLVRFSPESDDALGVELALGAGIFTLFDAFEDDLDNFGWEGSGFLALQYRPTYRFAAKFGLHHLSSHVGDEYLANYDVIHAPITDDAELANGGTYGFFYVRDSLLLGLSYQVSPLIRVYGEARYSMRMFEYMYCYNDYPWQAGGGFELVFKPRGIPSGTEFREGLGGWYIAADVSMYQESSWFPSTTVQVGWMMHSLSHGDRFRIGLEYYYGRAPLAVFNHTDGAEPTPWDSIPLEQYIGIGMWYDL